MNSKRQVEFDLPEIPDFPESPLPGWKHYGITNFAGQTTQEELNRNQYPGYLIGLRFRYTVLDGEAENAYEMSFGLVKPPEEQKYAKLMSPLTDDFMIKLYDAVNALLHQNIPEELGEIQSEINATLSGSVNFITIKCRLVQVGECDLGNNSPDNGATRLCIKVQEDPWRCLHAGCS
jgi:hypothetical protein